MTSETVSLVEAAAQLGVRTGVVLDLVLRRELAYSQAPSGRIVILRTALTDYAGRTNTTAG